MINQEFSVLWFESPGEFGVEFNLQMIKISAASLLGHLHPCPSLQPVVSKNSPKQTRRIWSILNYQPSFLITHFEIIH